MRKGTEYLSPQSRQDLAQSLREGRRERDNFRRRALDAESQLILDSFKNYLGLKGSSASLNRHADESERKTRLMLKRAEIKNTYGENFQVRDAIELENLLHDKERFSEADETEILRVYAVMEKHAAKIHITRNANPTREPGGLMRDDVLEWADRSAWKEGTFDSHLSLQERMNLGDQGAISFHCHPIKEGRDDFQTSASDGDYLAVVINRNEAIFAQGGEVILVTTKRYPFEETMAIIQRLRNESEQRPEGDGPWAMVQMVIDTFGIKSFTRKK